MGIFVDREGYPRTGRIVAAVVAAVVLIPLAVWGFSVLTSPVKGAGDAFKEKNSATNRIAKQERFEDLYAEITQADAKIAPAQAAYDANPTQVNQTNLTGLINYCLDVVGDYNAEARKYTAEDFRAVDLPAVIDSFNPQTDCK